jgi:hypothetical protein
MAVWADEEMEIWGIERRVDEEFRQYGKQLEEVVWVNGGSEPKLCTIQPSSA